MSNEIAGLDKILFTEELTAEVIDRSETLKWLARRSLKKMASRLEQKYNLK